MARDGSGNYARAESDYVSGTTISATPVNNELDDIANALSGSIAKDGQTPTTAPIPFVQGIITNTVAERTSAAGVTIDSVLLKDGGVQLGAAGTIVFEGATANDFETTLTVVDPTEDRTITLPDATFTVVGRDTTDTLTNKTLTSPALTTPTLTSPVIDTGVSGTAILDEDNMASDSATQLATQQSIKAYVDAQAVTLPVGAVLQTLQTVVSAATATIASATPAQIAGMSQSITTAANANKVLVRAMISLSGDSSNGASLFLRRDSTDIGIGDAAGDRIRITAAGGTAASISAIETCYIEYLDSPGAAGTYAYSVYWARLTGSTVKLNAARTDTDAATVARTISTITVQEIKG